jgi:hypothetical protein
MSATPIEFVGGPWDGKRLKLGAPLPAILYVRVLGSRSEVAVQWHHGDTPYVLMPTERAGVRRYEMAGLNLPS